MSRPILHIDNRRFKGCRKKNLPLTWLYRCAPMSWHHGDMPKQLPLVEPTVAPCCAPLASAPLSIGDAQTLAGQLKAVADPARLRLLSLMMANEDLEACTCDLTEALGLSQPTVSH